MSSSSSPVQVIASINGKQPVAMECDLLVIACDPRNLRDACDFSSQERVIFNRLENYTFHTTLVKVPVPPGGVQKPEFGVILSPTAVQNMNGLVSGYRNETAKQFSLETANAMSENLVTVYQMLGPGQPPWSTAEFLNVLRKTLPLVDWWPYQSFEICTDAAGKPITLTTPYFDHFNQSNLDARMPWLYLDVQGKNNTVFVHGSTCFESVLQCWQYGGMLLDNAAALGISLPADKASRIIVLGAGPSGMLFAHRLALRGYTNVQILEATDRIGGKTHTVTMDAPSPPGSHEVTPCELGTCYLSPAYDDMARALAAFMQGNVRHGFYMDPSHKNPKHLSFRGMVTDGQFAGVPISKKIMPYNDYVLLKGYYEANKPFADPVHWLSGFDADIVEVEIAARLTEYIILVEWYVGNNLPMPMGAPERLLNDGYTSFYDFLDKNGLLILVGLLEYSYSVQGYGPLRRISAYYGMIWISVQLIKKIIEDVLDSSGEAAVTVLSKGWLDVWKQMAPTLNIQTHAKVLRIKREGTSLPSVA